MRLEVLCRRGSFVLKPWTRGMWHLRWMLTDDFTVEQRTVFLLFVASRKEKRRSLTSFAWSFRIRTVDRRFSSKKESFGDGHRHQMAALNNRKTRPGCLESARAAIAAARTDKDNKYLDIECRGLPRNGQIMPASRTPSFSRLSVPMLGSCGTMV